LLRCRHASRVGGPAGGQPTVTHIVLCDLEVPAWLWHLDVRFINTLPVLMASRHSRESGNPGGEGHGDWMPAYAGMTFYWYRTYEMDI